MLYTWKSVKGYEGLYEVCDYGLVRSLERQTYSQTGKMNRYISETILFPSMDKDGYLGVTLCKETVQTKFRVHRLVADVFLENPDNLPVIDHINGIRWDNRVVNIRWVTHSTNVKHSFHLGRKMKGRPIIQSTLGGDFVKRFETIADVEKDGFNPKIINQAIIRGTNSSGFSWKYCDESHKKGGKEKQYKPIVRYSLDGQVVKYYPSIWKVSEDGFNPKGVNKTVLRKNKVYKGFVWKYFSQHKEGVPPPNYAFGFIG